MVSDSHYAQMRDLGERFRVAAGDFDWLSHEQRNVSRWFPVTRVHYMLLGTSPDGYRVRVRLGHRVEWSGPGGVRGSQGVPAIETRLDCVVIWPRGWRIKPPLPIADDRFKHRWSRRGIRTRRYAFVDHRRVDLATLVRDMLDVARTVATAPGRQG